MKILLVDDEDRSVRDAIDSIKREISDPEIVTVRSRDEAIAVIGEGRFDLIICDIRVPPHGNSADVREAHGLSVHAACRKTSPGTPLIFLTGFATSRDTRAQLAQGGVATVYGILNYPLVALVDKDDPIALEAKLRALEAGLLRLRTVEISGIEPPHQIFRRAVGLYALSLEHSRADVTLSPGLSGASVGRVHLSGEGETPAAIFLKTTGHADAADEYRRYRQYVSNRLAPGYFAPTHEPIFAGLGGASALVSTLADGTTSLFDLVMSSPARATEVVSRLREGLRPWTDSSRSSEEVTLGDVRRARLTDERLSRSPEASALASEVEPLKLEMRQVICHGDLHGENVLVDADGRPVLIDFGDTGPGFAPVDPVTLELSLLFHSSGPARRMDRIGDLNWSSWPDIEAFSAGSPLLPFVRATREWACEIATKAEIMAYAYAHAMRQVKYDDVDTAMAIAIAGSAARSLIR
jgi:CheY-like chemotaxis protein